ncbi:MAG TPA: acyl-CoA thioesterase [Candidatus Eisenbacteria bacterium]|nr:acyl-CoA thioesterase [Candidatus Eisenbacteria bacterium]
MSFAFTTPVRFQDVDGAGVLFFGRIYDYLHLAYEEFWVSGGVDRAYFFTGAPWVVPIVHSEADYRAPIRHGDTIRVGIDVVKVGKASFELRYAVTGGGGESDQRVAARTVHAFALRASEGRLKPTPIPEELRMFLLRHLVEEPVARDAS